LTLEGGGVRWGGEVEKLITLSFSSTVQWGGQVV
jgi:hypothetical protein